MSIEWFRDLSLIFMGFTTTVVLIIAAIIFCRLYGKITKLLVLVQTLVKSVNGTVNTVETSVKATSQNINDTITEVKDSIKTVSKDIGDTISQMKECIKPLLAVLSLIDGIREVFNYIKKMFTKECKETGGENGQGSDS
jgi:gas vesicle protein